MARSIAFFALALLTQSAPTESLAQGRALDYYIVSGDDSTVTFVDANSIKIDGNERSYWSVIYYSKPTTLRVSYVRSLEVADCAKETYYPVHRVFYDISDSVVSTTGRSQEPKPVVPETLMDETFQFVCASAAERLKTDRPKADGTREDALLWFGLYRAWKADSAAAPSGPAAGRDR